MARLDGVVRYGAALLEVASTEPFRIPEVLGKLFWARSRLGYGPEIFFLFDLHNRKIKTWSDYIGPADKGPKVLRSVNNKNRRAYSTSDKLATADRLTQAGVPSAPIVGVAGRKENAYELQSNYSNFQSTADLEAYLSSKDCPDAIFCKPAWGQKGQGAIGASRSKAEWKVNEEEISAGALAKRILVDSDSYGRLLQPVLKNHPEVEKITGDVGLNTIRFVTASTNSGPKIIVATQKLIGARSLADNFLGGVTGNLIAAIDLARGTLGACYGRRSGHRYLLTHYERHPVTDSKIQGVALPMWEKTCAVALSAARVLSDEPFLGFDVAITKDGPVVLEANNAWSWTLPQITASKGGKDLFGEVIRDLVIPDSDRTSALEALGVGK